ncbi:uncharacterized protein N7529_004578 [Penicillium soppii]|uniref:uncharacterized protein n=1 Tax=Penicillium soppii TaxID=69789 RepID=UPI0025484278|nr:uncharacterized protein N7529_004578 [Penicillium soppii]KAJ5872225.1 hypothetical protein N7529_004578 [Penicillium soppii]
MATPIDPQETVGPSPRGSVAGRAATQNCLLTNDPKEKFSSTRARSLLPRVPHLGNGLFFLNHTVA